METKKKGGGGGAAGKDSHTCESSTPNNQELKRYSARQELGREKSSSQAPVLEKYII